MPSSTLDPIYNLPTSTGMRRCVVFFIELINGNGNGNPDDDNRPRQFFDGRSWLSDACQKRWLRDYVAEFAKQQIYVERDTDLTATQQQYGIDTQDAKGNKERVLDRERILKERCDLRWFGSILPQFEQRVRGCVQFSHAVTIDPVDIEEIALTCSAFRKKDAKKGAKKGSKEDDDSEKRGSNMGHRHIVRYGLYRGTFFFDPVQAARNGFTEEDMGLIYGGLIEGLEYNRSANRTDMHLRSIYVFDTEAVRGVEPSHITTNRVSAKLKDGLEAPTKFEDYDIQVNAQLPKGMALYSWQDGVKGPRVVG